MSNMGAWPALAPALAEIADRIGVGLHLNLTTGSPLGPAPTLAPGDRFVALKDLMLRAFQGRLHPREVRAEIERQLAAFERFFGAAPAFVDGHQHVHVLPVVRSALIAVLRERGYAGRIWLRDPSDGVLPILRREVGARKALVVRALAIGFSQAARAGGFATNQGFSGFSPLDDQVPAERVFGSAFLDLGLRPVVMCHPGHADEALRALDPAVESRISELSYLASDSFSEMLLRRRLTLVPQP
jgi:predicted glycoside hydrolase/deacetylase ChbG (UPF0249 family)